MGEPPYVSNAQDRWRPTKGIESMSDDGMTQAIEAMIVDVIITPTNPTSNRYRIKGNTPAGEIYINTLVQRLPDLIQSGEPLRRFKESLTACGLTFTTDWSSALEPKIDP